MAGLLLPRDPIVGISDDPAIDAGGGITPTSYNLGIKLTEGSDKQLVERSVAADGTSGINLTSTPTVSYAIFPLNVDPATLPVGGFTIAESGGVLTFWAKRTDGTLVSMALG